MTPATSLRADLAALEERIRQFGADRPRPLRVFAEWLLALFLGVSGMLLLYDGALPLLVRAAALLVSTLGFVVLGTIGHTASHGGFSRSAAGNQILFYATYPLLGMLSARYWRHSHIHVHHSAPNVVGIDDDQGDVHVFVEGSNHLLALACTQATSIDKDAGKLVAHCTVYQEGCNCRIDTAGESTEYACIADALTNLYRCLLND